MTGALHAKINRHGSDSVAACGGGVLSSEVDVSVARDLTSPQAGISRGEFLAADGAFDLAAVRRSGYGGTLGLEGFEVAFNPDTGEPLTMPSTTSDFTKPPDDVFCLPV